MCERHRLNQSTDLGSEGGVDKALGGDTAHSSSSVLFIFFGGGREMRAERARALSRDNMPTSRADKPNPWQTGPHRFASGCIVVSKVLDWDMLAAKLVMLGGLLNECLNKATGGFSCFTKLVLCSLVVCELRARVDICITVLLVDMWSPHVETPVL